MRTTNYMRRDPSIVSFIALEGTCRWMTFYLVRAIVPRSSGPANSLILVWTFLSVLVLLELFRMIVWFWRRTSYE